MHALERESKTRMFHWCVLASEDYLSNITKLVPQTRLFGTTRTFCFHAQQMVEKYLKGYLVLNQVEFKRTHDISDLCKQCVEIDERFEKLFDDLKELTRHAVETRYADVEDRIPSFARSKQMFRIAIELELFLKEINVDMENAIEKIKDKIHENNEIFVSAHTMDWFVDSEDWEIEKDAIRYIESDFSIDDEEGYEKTEERLLSAFEAYSEQQKKETLFPDGYPIDTEQDSETEFEPGL